MCVGKGVLRCNPCSKDQIGDKIILHQEQEAKIVAKADEQRNENCDPDQALLHERTLAFREGRGIEVAVVSGRHPSEQVDSPFKQNMPAVSID